MTEARFPAGTIKVHTGGGGAACAVVTRLRGRGRAEAATAAARPRGGNTTTALCLNHHEHQTGHLQVSLRLCGVPERRAVWGLSPGALGDECALVLPPGKLRLERIRGRLPRCSPSGVLGPRRGPGGVWPCFMTEPQGEASAGLCWSEAWPLWLEGRASQAVRVRGLGGGLWKQSRAGRGDAGRSEGARKGRLRAGRRHRRGLLIDDEGLRGAEARKRPWFSANSKTPPTQTLQRRSK